MAKLERNSFYKIEERLEMKISISIMFIFFFLITGCAVGIERVGYLQPESSCSPKAGYHKIVIKHQASFTDQDVTILGIIKSYEKGFSINCDEISVLNIFEMDARAIGADIVNVVSEKYPDFRSTCYRSTAELIRLNNRNEAASLFTDDYYSNENLTARQKAADAEFHRAMEAGFIGGLAAGVPVSR
jgi:hypothetical protein